MCVRFSLILGFLLSLSACSKDNNAEKITHFTQSVKNEITPHAEALPEFHSPLPISPVAPLKRNPFAPEIASSQLKPIMNPSTGPLTQFSLSDLVFVGYLYQGKEATALIKAPNHLIYSAKVGETLGKNFGKITAITANQIEIEELIPDGLGGWARRSNQLTLDNSSTEDKKP